MRVTALACCAILLVPAVHAQPVVSHFGIANAASFYSEEGPGETRTGEIAPGSIFVVAGRNLGPIETRTAWDSPPRELSGVSITVSVGGSTHDAAVVYASAGLVAGILPPETPPGAGTAVITYEGQTTAPVRLRVTPQSFGIFAKGGRGFGPAVAYNITGGEQRLNTFLETSRPGQRMVVWATGIGRDTAAVEVVVGDRTAAGFSRPAECCRGVDQIAFDVPEEIEGCFVPVFVRSGDGEVSRNAVTISVSRDGSACSDPHNLPASELQRIQEGQTVSRGVIRLREYQGMVHATGEFSPAADLFLTNSALPPPGACIESRFHSTVPFPVIPAPVSRTPGPRLDAGRVLQLRSPEGVFEVSRLPGRFYTQPWPPGLARRAGEYVVDNGSGGSDVGSFQVAISLPAEPFVWTNPHLTHPVSTARDLSISWHGGDSLREYVVISGAIELAAGAAGFVCTERSAKGSFTVPARILRSLVLGSVPQALWGPDPGWMATVAVAGRSFPVPFQARGLDGGVISYDSESLMNVWLQ
jgi:uncharacterized protein (TIGR03437 family)